MRNASLKVAASMARRAAVVLSMRDVYHAGSILPPPLMSNGFVRPPLTRAFGPNGH